MLFQFGAQEGFVAQVEELGMAVGSSKAQLHRARGLLRMRIGDAL